MQNVIPSCMHDKMMFLTFKIRKWTRLTVLILFFLFTKNKESTCMLIESTNVKYLAFLLVKVNFWTEYTENLRTDDYWTSSTNYFRLQQKTKHQFWFKRMFANSLLSYKVHSQISGVLNK